MEWLRTKRLVEIARLPRRRGEQERFLADGLRWGDLELFFVFGEVGRFFEDTLRGGLERFFGLGGREALRGDLERFFNLGALGRFLAFVSLDFPLSLALFFITPRD